ncbi:MAG: 7-carboxy-7-deazaguanine synthase QueE [Bacteroidales bacterium]
MNSRLKSGESLPLVEIFYSLQGEGYNFGRALHFIRLAGCDIQCSWCDSKESWNRESYPLISIEEIISKISLHHSKEVVITGGEPTLYNLLPLTTTLKERGYYTYLESSGAYPLLGHFDWITISPKKWKPPLLENLKKASELKVVIEGKEDFLWAEENRRLVPESTRVYLQPEWSKREEVAKMVVGYIKENPYWRLSLQTHNYLDIP